jgi:hypothetical protein
MVCRPLWCVLLLAAGGCGSEETELFGPTGPGGGKADNTFESHSLDGAYQLEITSWSQFEDRDSGETFDKTTAIDALIRIRPSPEGETASLVIQPCQVRLPAVKGHLPCLPDDTVQQMGVQTVTAELLQGEADGELELSTRRFIFTLGVELDDPRQEQLPEEPDDPRVIDEDGDGFPGVSVKIGWFRIYVALRIELALRGSVYASVTEETRPTVEGTVKIGLDQRIYGDDIPFYDAAGAAEEALLQNELVDGAHTFRLAPTDAATCSGI